MLRQAMTRLRVTEVVRKVKTPPIVSCRTTLPHNDSEASGYPQNKSRRLYHTSSPLEIKHINSDLTEEEMKAELEQELAKLEEMEEVKKYKDWKPGHRKRPLFMSYNEKDFVEELEGRSTWSPRLDQRCGALAIKVGMMPVWDEWGERHPCSVLFIDRNVVIKTFTEEKDGYMGVQIGAGERKAKNVTKPLMGHYQAHDLTHAPYRVREFRVSEKDYLPEPGTQIHARHFIPGQAVDVSAISKGKGFQGAMKRWNFSGMPASHGTSVSHRSLGSTGQCQDPGRVFKGKKMAGRMGGKRVTVQNLRIVKVDAGRNLIYVRGAVPGPKGEFVELKDSVKRPLFGTEKVLDGAEKPPLPTFVGEEGIDGSNEAGHEMFMPMAIIDPFDPPMGEAA